MNTYTSNLGQSEAYGYAMAEPSYTLTAGPGNAVSYTASSIINQK